MNAWLMVWSDAMQRTLLPITIAIAVLWWIESATRWLSPQQRCWLWRFSFAKCLLVLCIPFALPMPSFVSDRLHIDALSPTAKASPINRETQSDHLLMRLSVDEPLHRSVSGTETPPLPAPPTAAASLGLMSNIPTMLFSCWGIGIALQIIVFVHRHNQLQTSLRRGKVNDVSPALRMMYREITDQMGIRHPPTLQRNDRFASPALVWNGRAMLVLPADFQSRHGDEGCRAAMAHELAHHRRGDLYWNTLVTLVCSVLFFFPPLWLARRRYRIAMESTCDWDAMTYAGVKPATYARLLIELLEPPARPTPARTRPALTIVSMAGSEPFHTLSERLNTMKRFDGATRRNRGIHTAVMLLMLCVLIPWTHADDKYNKDTKATQSSSATVTSSSSSQSFGNGNTRSISSVTGSANGNASGSGAANGKASSLKMRNGNDTKANQSTSSAEATVEGQTKPANRYGSANPKTTTSNQASSTSSIQRDGVKISRSIYSENGFTQTKMDVTDKTEEFRVRESSDEGIEVRVRDRKQNPDGSLNEKVYTAKTWDELQQQAPALVRKIKRYEKMAGNLTVSTDVRDGIATASSIADAFANDINVVQLDAKEMMKAQLREMLDKHADNPQMQKMIRKTLDSLDKD
ncbi:M56 family metallopeptidase [Novipirellula caenicola]|uniref:Peptidase M56 domain-containing protein n=1 Tax=Novipirellula caenicola TaxID=1536901 RepID=A0ABP9VID4_9BACT